MGFPIALFANENVRATGISLDRDFGPHPRWKAIFEFGRIYPIVFMWLTGAHTRTGYALNRNIKLFAFNVQFEGFSDVWEDPKGIFGDKDIPAPYLVWR
jgi:hypothetical protein